MLRVYRYLTYFFFPLLIVLVYLRSVFNKEHKMKNNSFAPNQTYTKNTFFDEYYKKLDSRKRGAL